MPDLTLVAAVTIFIATYAVIALGKIPIYRLDRAGAALLGGSLMVATGVLTIEQHLNKRTPGRRGLTVS